MKLKEGTEVFTQEGKKIGEITRVVLDPDTKEITHVVVRRGHLFTKDRLIPAGLLEIDSDHRMCFTRPLNSPDDLPEFEADHYYDYIVSQDHGKHPLPPLMYVPPSGLDWWVHAGRHRYPGPTPPERHFLHVRQENIPEGKVALREGARVVSADGDPVGRLEEVITDENHNRITHLVISKGLLSRHRKVIPAFWVREIREDQLLLSMPAEFLEVLPDMKE
jgi:sporulation protein YlmC with PRC-barrel domain